MNRAARIALLSVAVTATPMATVLQASAQQNQFGIDQRAQAASQMIVLGVQQGISSLPPASGQAFNYAYDSELGAFVASKELGPTVLRSPAVIGSNRLSVRFATSYFQLGETFDPIDYQANFAGDPDNYFTKFGMSASANVTLFNVAATYGITDRIELTLNVPFSVVQAKAFQTFVTFPPPFPPAREAQVAAVSGSVDNLDAALAAGDVALRTLSFGALGSDFNTGNQVGLGRISLGGKGSLWANDLAEVAFATEFFVNSPSQAQYAGSDSPSILPRLIGTLKPAPWVRLYTDVGYDYDFDVAELRRFVWNLGVSVPITNATFDAGFGGSLFDEGIRWTPVSARGVDAFGAPVTIRALDPSATQLGTNYVAFLFGAKVRLFEGAVLGGAVNVPVTSDTFRADAIGTLSLEYYFM